MREFCVTWESEGQDKSVYFFAKGRKSIELKNAKNQAAAIVSADEGAKTHQYLGFSWRYFRLSWNLKTTGASKSLLLACGVDDPRVLRPYSVTYKRTYIHPKIKQPTTDLSFSTIFFARTKAQAKTKVQAHIEQLPADDLPNPPPSKYEITGEVVCKIEEEVVFSISHEVKVACVGRS